LLDALIHFINPNHLVNEAYGVSFICWRRTIPFILSVSSLNLLSIAGHSFTSYP
jgi:hypothetical protein